jgi:hypothetical protein
MARERDWEGTGEGGMSMIGGGSVELYSTDLCFGLNFLDPQNFCAHKSNLQIE